MTKHVQHVVNTVDVHIQNHRGDGTEKESDHPGEKSQSGDESRRKPCEHKEAQDLQKRSRVRSGLVDSVKNTERS